MHTVEYESIQKTKCSLRTAFSRTKYLSLIVLHVNYGLYSSLYLFIFLAKVRCPEVPKENNALCYYESS